MDGVKSLLASKTFWGGLVAVVAGVAGFFGYTLGADDQQAIIEIIAGVGSTIGGLVAIWGRIVASKKIELD